MITSPTGNISRVTGPLYGEFTGHRWVSLTKASDAELWCFLWSPSEKGLGKQSGRLCFMMTSSNGNIFRVTSHLCGNSPVPGEFPTQRPVTRSFDVYFDLRPNKRLSKQSWGWWFETLSWSLWRHCNDRSSSRSASWDNDNDELKHR